MMREDEKQYSIPTLSRGYIYQEMNEISNIPGDE